MTRQIIVVAAKNSDVEHSGAQRLPTLQAAYKHPGNVVTEVARDKMVELKHFCQDAVAKRVLILLLLWSLGAAMLTTAIATFELHIGWSQAHHGACTEFSRCALARRKNVSAPVTTIDGPTASHSSELSTGIKYSAIFCVVEPVKNVAFAVRVGFCCCDADVDARAI